MVDSKPLVPSVLGLQLVAGDDDDVLATILQPFDEAATDATAAYDDDAHWEYLERLCDAPGESALEHDRRQDDQEDRSDEDARCVGIRRPEFPRWPPGTCGPFEESG